MAAVSSGDIYVYIDADNINANEVDIACSDILEKEEGKGRLFFIAISDWQLTRDRGWPEVALTYGIDCVQQFNYAKQTNSTDMRLSIEVMNLLALAEKKEKMVQAVWVVSNDADFIPLAEQLKMRGIPCKGYFTRSHHQCLAEAYSEWMKLENLVEHPELREIGLVKVAEANQQTGGGIESEGLFDGASETPMTHIFQKAMSRVGLPKKRGPLLNEVDLNEVKFIYKRPELSSKAYKPFFKALEGYISSHCRFIRTQQAWPSILNAMSDSEKDDFRQAVSESVLSEGGGFSFLNNVLKLYDMNFHEVETTARGPNSNGRDFVVVRPFTYLSVFESHTVAGEI